MVDNNLTDNNRVQKKGYNTYYIFQNSSGNPSGNYNINPYIAKNSIIVADETLDKKSSAWNFEGPGLY